MKVTQIANPFNCKVSGSGISVLSVIIALVLIGGAIYFILNKDKITEKLKSLNIVF